MRLKPAAIDIFLQPGEIYFGDRNTRIRTLLGSCVAITVWHARKKIGGMCHYMLPARGQPTAEALDGRYADEAVLLLLREIADAQTDPRDYQVKVFGGGNMFVRSKKMPGRSKPMNIAGRNIDVAEQLLALHGFVAAADHVGGDGYREIVFEISSGDVWLRQHSNTMQTAEAP
jgi:chemotaxis protein CheD